MAAKWAELGSGGSPGTMAEKKAALVAGGLAVLSKGAALAKAGGGASIGAFKVTRPCRTPPPPPAAPSPSCAPWCSEGTRCGSRPEQAAPAQPTGAIPGAGAHREECRRRLPDLPGLLIVRRTRKARGGSCSVE